jgi:subtilisin family serine protease
MKKYMLPLVIFLIILNFSLAYADGQDIVQQLQSSKKIEPLLISYVKNITTKSALSRERGIPVIVLLQENENPQVFISKLLTSKKLNGNFITFSWINGFAAQFSPNEITEISLMSEVKRIYLDKKINITSLLTSLSEAMKTLNTTQYNVESNEESLNESAHQIGADYLWNLGFKGQGIKIAVLDTGIDKSHPALKGKVIFEKDLTWWDDKLDPNDYFGHGTHVAGIIAGYYENGSVNITQTSVTYFYVEREINAVNQTQIAVYKIKAIGPYPPLGMLEDPAFPLGTNHVKFYDKDGTPIEVFTYGNISCNPQEKKCEEVWKPEEFTLVKIRDKALNVGENYTNSTTNTTISYVNNNNVTIISTVTFQRPQEIISGMAPNASLMNFKVLGDDGFGFESSVIKGIELAAENGANIISMSLGAFGHPDDILSQVVDKAVEKGIVVVAAAGNEGFFLFSIGSPGTARKALTIGCVDKENFPCWFTSWGPLVSGENKPDISAPGYQIISACAENSYLGRLYGCNYTENKLFIPLSGTSMSTPHVAGLAALLLNAKNTLSPEEVKSLLVQNVVNQTISPFPIIVGSGVVNGTEAYLSLSEYGLVFNPSTLFFGYIYDEYNNITLRVKNVLNTSVSYSLKYYAGWPTEETFTDLVYSPNSSLTLAPNEEKSLILYINSSKVKELLENVTEFINFIPFYVYMEINNSKNYTFPSTVILPEELNISSLDAYSTLYSKVEKLSFPLRKWYWINVYNDTEWIEFACHISETGFGIFGVIDPENKVREKDFCSIWYSSIWEVYPKTGKWKIAAFGVGVNSSLELQAEKPTLFIDWSLAEGTPGDNFVFRKKIKNLVESPLNITVTKRIDSYISDRLLDKKSDTILYPSGMGYYEFNISNYTEGVRFDFNFLNNTLFGCYYFEVFFFDPEGKLNTTRSISFCSYGFPFFGVIPLPYYSLTPPSYTLILPVYSENSEMSLIAPEKGTWTIVVVPYYWYWWYERDREQAINLTIEMKDLIKEKAWSNPLNSLNISPGEEAFSEFNVSIPENVAPWTWHTDIYQIDVVGASCSATRDIFVDAWVRPFSFLLNITNKTELVNDKGIKYFLVNYNETLSLVAQLFGYNNTPKESYANFTFIKVLKFINETWRSWDGEVYSYVYPIIDYENEFTTEFYHINGTTLISLTLPKWISQGYWVLYGTENKTNSFSNPVYFFVNSPVIDIQTSPNSTLALNFSSKGIHLESFFNYSTRGHISVERVSDITTPTDLVSINIVQIELSDNLKNTHQWSIIRFYYDPDFIGNNRIDENSLSIYWFNEATKRWEKLSSFVNKLQYYVEANVTHFSIYALFGTVLPTSQPTPTGGGFAGSIGGGGGLVGGAFTKLEECAENWTCSEWSECFPNNTQIRTCVDLNKCNTTKNKPTEVRSCIYATSILPSICGNKVCEANETQENCCLDCGCPTGYECENNACVKIQEKLPPTPAKPIGTTARIISIVVNPIFASLLTLAIIAVALIVLKRKSRK